MKPLPRRRAWEEPSPKRKEAGAKNRVKRPPLSEATRQRLREAAFKNRPWEHSTGPTTDWGKYFSAKNGKLRQKGEVSIRMAQAIVKAERELFEYLVRSSNAMVSQHCR